MSVSDILSIVLLLEKLAQHKTLLFRVLSLFVAILKRIAGGFVLLFGSMWIVATPYGAWNAATTTSIASTYSLATVIIALATTVSLLGMIGLLIIGFGAMYAAPNSRVGKHFRYRVFVKRRRATGVPVRMFFRITIMKLAGTLRPKSDL